MLKDRDGNELHFGDVVTSTYGPAKAYRFAWESLHKGKGEKRFVTGRFYTMSGVFVDFLPTEDGRIAEVLLRVEDKDRTVQGHGRWISSAGQGGAITICECCGAPVPTRTEVDSITPDDNRYCYYCGARMARGRQA